MKHTTTFFAFLFLLIFNITAQQKSLLDEAKLLDKKIKTEEALKLYDQLLISEPENIAVLVRCVELNSFLGNVQVEEEKKHTYFDKAYVYAQKAYELDSLTVLPNYAMSLVLGCLINSKPIKEKLPLTKKIWQFASAALAADSSHARSLYLLGKWNDEIAGLNPASRAALKILYRDMPKASTEIAIFYYEKARKLDPSLIINNYHLAIAYKKIGFSNLSLEILTATVKLAPISVEDQEYKSKAKSLLESLK